MTTKKKLQPGEILFGNNEARVIPDYFPNPMNSRKCEFYKLSKRELDVLNRLLMGDSYKMIANTFSINIGTVNSHINNLYKKMHVNSKSEAVIKAIRENLV
jgi:DNA-binding NarL/FixJ family response regulator